MATVVNNPQPATSDNGMGFFIGAILIIFFAIIFFVYILPTIRTSFGAPQVNVPDKIDVNVNHK